MTQNISGDLAAKLVVGPHVVALDSQPGGRDAGCPGIRFATVRWRVADPDLEGGRQ